MAGSIKMYLFVMIWETRKFESVVGASTQETTYESGDPILLDGKEAVVLGTALTRSEAKEKGTEYYNQVSALHGDGEWEFNTQTFDHEPCFSVQESDRSDEVSDGSDEDDPEPLTKRRRME
ncbi:G-type lectin S-receptor-like serine/threonine-protein kinase SD1-29 [Frankliniella fusca]|uniref:G-type lectin S-receptor-like serine/threonine-protein kinase SD1-29 n=1 Tax=Frankliniella fusca TaxID=407009 RepID=A0AAE1HS66_9NEOP|nr:G-type lectin S-receptor-like serine/threonine-protein kinase SD1-29 [Frankliniella fusca]KAK3929714.1 G-type lectin S-receptor-like serine/threonine-protein kinase SD1-29 [Frankliniella fusca]